MAGGEDAFSIKLRQEFEQKGIPLPGSTRYKDKAGIRRLMLGLGLRASVSDMWEVYQKLAGRAQVEALEEVGDERVWQCLMEHYCLVRAWSD
jgi:hypothetical protein